MGEQHHALAFGLLERDVDRCEGGAGGLADPVRALPERALGEVGQQAAGGVVQQGQRPAEQVGEVGRVEHQHLPIRADAVDEEPGLVRRRIRERPRRAVAIDLRRTEDQAHRRLEARPHARPGGQSARDGGNRQVGDGQRRFKQRFRLDQLELGRRAGERRARIRVTEDRAPELQTGGSNRLVSVRREPYRFGKHRVFILLGMAQSKHRARCAGKLCDRFFDCLVMKSFRSGPWPEVFDPHEEARSGAAGGSMHVPSRGAMDDGARGLHADFTGPPVTIIGGWLHRSRAYLYSFLLSVRFSCSASPS